MHLKSITLKGFKSFPDRTTLQFDPGVSVIVGPNGSGKSNVTDAVLWALGEQSPLAVRGQSMQDVIFAGAPGRQAAASAEVELVLDDSQGTLGLGSPEVSILRRIDRAGEGEYRLAGARCRLVDVIELLSDTGLGKEMHSVVSQGRVEAVITSKPRDRRLLIEEAAGLGKHRKRRRRAQLKLARTQENLDRALDVEREARSRLRPLKRQAEAADHHARLERQMLQARWQLAREDVRIRLQQLEQASVQAEEARQARRVLEGDLDQVSRRREAAEEALARRSGEREELSRRCFAASSAGERVVDRAAAARSARAEIESRLARSGELIATLESRLGGTEPSSARAERIGELEAKLAVLDREREAELSRQAGELESQLALARALLEERAGEVKEARSARHGEEEELEQAWAALRGAERGLEDARRRRAGAAGELAAAEQFLSSQAGAPAGTPALADRLEVDPGYEMAVAAVLGGRLRAALASDRADATRLLERCGTEGGRALVARTHQDTGAVPGQPRPLSFAELLSDHVRGPAEVLSLARTLLRDAWLVDSLDRVPDSFSGVAVTRGGRVWSAWAGELRQAPLAGEERLLAERNRRAELVRAREAAEKAEHGARQELERCAQLCERLAARCERARAQQRAAIERHDEAGEEERRAAARLQRLHAAPDESPHAARRLRLEAELSNERSALAAAQRERAERIALLERLRAQRARDEVLMPALGRLLAALEQAAAAISLQRGSFEADLAADREAGEQVAAELRECARQEARLHASLHGRSEELTEAEVRLQRDRDRLAEAQRELGTLAGKLELEAVPGAAALELEERQALEGRLERLARRRELLGPINPLAQQEYSEALEHVEELERQRGDLEVALRELQKLIADTDRQIREAFEHTFHAAARSFEQVVERLFPGGRGRLRLVTASEAPARVLGGEAQTANPPADDQEEQESSDEEERLGVEIEVTPAGKEMKRLSLLSGGEKSMTALAFLFAVFLARPCPFYVLDEVEAALDDLNMDRFLELLRAYSERAQFIVVTHQKRTMEAADCLYGVSMGSDGVSKVISRRLPQQQAA